MRGDSDKVGGSIRNETSTAVVEAVAEREGVEPERLVPPEYESLHDVVDPEALDALFAPKRDGTPRSNGTVSFRFCGYGVTVEGDGTVTVE